MTTLQKSIALTFAAAIIALTLASDVEAGRGRRGGFSRGIRSSVSRGSSSRRILSQGKSRRNSSSQLQFGSSRNNRSRSNRGSNLMNAIRGNSRSKTSGNFKPSSTRSRSNSRSLFNRNGRGSSRSFSKNLIISGKHKGKHRWHIGFYRPYRSFSKSSYVPCTTGFGFNYSCQQPTYVNPYCSPVILGTPAPLFDDSIQLAGQEDLVTETATGKDGFEKAREAFFEGDLKTALPLINQAAKEMPGNPNVQQFRSLVLFAMKDYDNAAAAAYTALTIGPGWDWDTLKSLFPSVEIYTSLLRALEEEMAKDPTITSKKFLLAYHYLMLGEKEAAGKQLEVVVQSEKENDVAVQLLKMIGRTPQGQVEESSLPPAPSE